MKMGAALKSCKAWAMSLLRGKRPARSDCATGWMRRTWLPWSPARGATVIDEWENRPGASGEPVLVDLLSSFIEDIHTIFLAQDGPSAVRKGE